MDSPMATTTNRKAASTITKHVRQRRTFSQEFKQEAVQMLLDGHSAVSVADRLGLPGPNLLYRWKRDALRQAGPAARTLGASPLRAFATVSLPLAAPGIDRNEKQRRRYDDANRVASPEPEPSFHQCRPAKDVGRPQDTDEHPAHDGGARGLSMGRRPSGAGAAAAARARRASPVHDAHLPRRDEGAVARTTRGGPDDTTLARAHLVGDPRPSVRRPEHEPPLLRGPDAGRLRPRHPAGPPRVGAALAGRRHLRVGRRDHQPAVRRRRQRPHRLGSHAPVERLRPDHLLRALRGVPDGDVSRTPFSSSLYPHTAFRSLAPATSHGPRRPRLISSALAREMLSLSLEPARSDTPVSG